MTEAELEFIRDCLEAAMDETKDDDLADNIDAALQIVYADLNEFRDDEDDPYAEEPDIEDYD